MTAFGTSSCVASCSKISWNDSTLVGGVASTVQVALHPVFSGFLGFQWSITTWLVSSAVCDVAIAISLALSLVSHQISSSLQHFYL